MIKMTFIDANGMRHEVAVREGSSVLEVAHTYGFELEGTCEGCMACSTCHVVVDEGWFPKLEKATEEEEDMLDLACEVRPTSRLGCQISMTSDLDGLVVSMPTQHFDFMRS